MSLADDWMSGSELSQAIPPAFTQFIGEYLMEAVVSRSTRPHRTVRSR